MNLSAAKVPARQTSISSPSCQFTSPFFFFIIKSRMWLCRLPRILRCIFKNNKFVLCKSACNLHFNIITIFPVYFTFQVGMKSSDIRLNMPLDEYKKLKIARKECDKKLQKAWTAIRKMIVEDGLR